MKLVNLVARKILEIMGYAWRWLKGVIFGLIVGGVGMASILVHYYEDEFGIGVAQKEKKK